MDSKIVVLSGGVGGARFLEGLVQVIPQEKIFVIGNTGDDEIFYGLHVSPDLDIVVYTLAGVVNELQGWGFKDETYSVMDQLTTLGNPDWFRLGDRDLATHIHRTNLLKQGKTLSQVTDELCRQFGLRIKLVPMSDQPVHTKMKTSRGTIPFQEYFVKNKTQDTVTAITFEGIEKAKPAPGILKAISDAKIIILAPSNPYVSIGSILAVPGIRNALQQTKANIVAISPIIKGAAIKGPADKMLKSMHREASAVGVAGLYKDFVDTMVIDNQDKELANQMQQLGMKTIITNTIMKDKKAKKDLAKVVLNALIS